MGLFDNIFLDQDTPTQMLDPLLTPEQKKAQEEKFAAEKAKKEMSSVTQTTSTSDGFDTMMTPAVESAEVHPDHAAIDAVSFDIGGVEMPGLDASTPNTGTADTVGAGFLSGTVATSPTSDFTIPDIGGMDFSLENTVSDTKDTPTDSSIALVQGATAVSSDAIVSAENTIQIDAEEDVHPDEVALIVATADHPPENNTLTSPSSDMTPTTLESPQTTDTAGGIFDLLGSAPAPDTPSIAIQTPESPSTDIPTFSLITDTSIDPTSITTHSDEIGSIDFDSTHLDARNSLPHVDTEDVVARMAPSHELDASLQEMLQEFVTKLEKFKSENGDVDEEMQEGLAFVAQARKDLEEEHRVRLLALEYQEKSIREKGEKKIAEKARLEGIIRNLKKEMQA